MITGLSSDSALRAGLTEGREKFGGFQLGRIAHDHRLAPAQWQARSGVLVGHAAGQAQHVFDGRGLIWVTLHPQPASGRSHLRGMDCDKADKSAIGFFDPDDILVLRRVDRRDFQLETSDITYDFHIF